MATTVEEDARFNAAEKYCEYIYRLGNSRTLYPILLKIRDEIRKQLQDTRSARSPQEERACNIGMQWIDVLIAETLKKIKDITKKLPNLAFAYYTVREKQGLELIGEPRFNVDVLQAEEHRKAQMFFDCNREAAHMISTLSYDQVESFRKKPGRCYFLGSVHVPIYATLEEEDRCFMSMEEYQLFGLLKPELARLTSRRQNGTPLEDPEGYNRYQPKGVMTWEAHLKSMGYAKPQSPPPQSPPPPATTLTENEPSGKYLEDLPSSKQQNQTDDPFSAHLAPAKPPTTDDNDVDKDDGTTKSPRNHPSSESDESSDSDSDSPPNNPPAPRKANLQTNRFNKGNGVKNARNVRNRVTRSAKTTPKPITKKAKPKVSKSSAEKPSNIFSKLQNPMQWAVPVPYKDDTEENRKLWKKQVTSADCTISRWPQLKDWREKANALRVCGFTRELALARWDDRERREAGIKPTKKEKDSWDAKNKAKPENMGEWLAKLSGEWKWDESEQKKFFDEKMGLIDEKMESETEDNADVEMGGIGEDKAEDADETEDAEMADK